MFLNVRVTKTGTDEALSGTEAVEASARTRIDKVLTGTRTDE